MQTGRFTDVGGAYTYDISPLRQERRAEVFTLSFPSPLSTGCGENDNVRGEWFVPRRAKGPVPTVVVLHMISGSFPLVRLACRALAGAGVGAFMMYLPHAGPRAAAGARRRLRREPLFFLEMLRQAVQDTERAGWLLAQRPEVAGVGLMGISLGGLVAATAGAQCPLFGKTFLLLAGGDLMEILNRAFLARRMARAFTGMDEGLRARISEQLAEVEPLSHAAGFGERARAGGLFMLNAKYDHVIPPEQSRLLADAAGLGRDHVRWIPSGHYTALLFLPRLLWETARFFRQPDGNHECAIDVSRR